KNKTKIKTLTMIGDVMVIGQPNNRPFDQYPRNVAKGALAYMRSTGIADEMILGPEYEFYVFDRVNHECLPQRNGCQVDTAEAYWNSAAPAGNAGFCTPRQGGYHIDLPNDIAYDLRCRMSELLEQWGVPVKYHHHEVGGPGQLEIEVQLDNMLHMADATMIAKYVIRNAAVQAGKTATLMPKPIYGEAGNGMHVHMLLMKDGAPIFYDKDGYGQLSETALHFIGGLLYHIKSLCAWTNPSTNSFKRLVPGFEAPVTIGYAMANRSAVVRIPAYAKTPAHKRFELRNPDATCNPYYAYAAILMAGLDGINRRIDPREHGWGPYDCNLYELPEEEKAKIESLPTNLSAALDALEADHGYLLEGGVFPEHLLRAWVQRKREEIRCIDRVPHPAEFTWYYDL
ncbi:MAG: type I glutamate--ammonia ligase, partial [Clostridia bacterium]|nr:type I glutamate--ammonia ligase [Clostridia bacterium]